MLKFLFYLLITYVIVRLLFGRILGGSKTRVFRFETHHHYHNQKKEEGSITVDPRTVKPVKDDKNLGEYVDYEDVK